MADLCLHCEGEMDEFGGIHLASCPLGDELVERPALDDRLVDLARRVDHLANCLASTQPASPSPVEGGDWPNEIWVSLEDGLVSEITWSEETHLSDARRYVPATSEQEAGEVEG